MRGRVVCAGAFGIVSLWTVFGVVPEAYAIGFADPNNYLDVTRPWLWDELPADLSIPDTGAISGFGVAIAPNWILGAHHQAGGLNPGDPIEFVIPTPDPNDDPWETTTVTYWVDNEIDSIRKIVANPDTGSVNDIILIRISADDEGNDPADLPYYSLLRDVLPNSVVTLGGFGNTYTPGMYFDGVPHTYLGAGIEDAGDSQSRGLRWGKNIVAVSEAMLSYDLDEHGSPGSVPYEAIGRSGDSGSGIFIRDGWEWKLAGTTLTGDSWQGSPPPHASAIGKVATAVRVSANLDWIIEELDADLPAYTPPPVPVADTEWQGLTAQNWSISSWTNGVPTNTQNAWVNNDPRITSSSGVATAKNLFVGVDGAPQDDPQGIMRVEDGGELQVVDSIYIGVEEGDTGWFRQTDATVKATSLYVGYYGWGSYRHDSGTTEVGQLQVGRYDVSTETPSRFTMYASNGSLIAGAIQIAGGENGHGKFEIKSGGSQVVNSQSTIVGSYGNGLFLQSGGTLQTDSLILGYGSTGEGAYELEGGNLITSTTTVGRVGSGTFLQTGGNHATTKLVIDASSSYEMSDGALAADEIHGTIDFADGTATVTGSANKIIDYTNATFLNASNAELIVPEDSLVFLQPNTQQPFGNVSGGVAPHIVGTTLTISGGGFRGTATIDDPIVMEDEGYLTAIEGIGNTLFLNKGVRVDSGHARIKAEDESEMYVYADTSLGGTAGIQVDSGASLSVSGNIILSGANTSLTVDGTLSIEPMSSEQSVGWVRLWADSYENEVLSQSTASELSIRIAGTSTVLGEGFDKIRIVDGGMAQLGGTLSLELIEDYVPAPWDELAIIRGLSGSIVEGQFDSVQVDSGTILRQDVNDDQIALAILYPTTTGVEDVIVRASLPGDFNLDDQVNFTDIQIYLIGNSSYANGGGTWVDGDANGDGLVNFTDLQIVLTNYERSWSSQLLGGGNEIPEPSTLALTTLALLALIAHARRRK